jgi:hypothetical protein
MDLRIPLKSCAGPSVLGGLPSRDERLMRWAHILRRLGQEFSELRRLRSAIANDGGDEELVTEPARRGLQRYV